MDLDARSPVEWLIDRAPISVSERMALRSVAEVMTTAHVGAAVVRHDDDRLAGIVTERDVLRAIAAGADPDVVWVADVMTPGLVAASPDEPIVEVVMRLLEAEIRHVAVVRGADCVGVVGMRDLLRAMTEDYRSRLTG